MKAHFIGIGGIGISALAQLYVHDGWEVVGTNEEPSPATLDRIRDLGVTIHIGVDVGNIERDTNLIVYSSAWDSREPEFMSAVLALGIPTLTYFEALGQVSEGKRTIAVTGTHGKTTTTGMLAKLLRDASVSPTAIVGSIVKDFGSNYLPGDSNLFVVEACEYQRHFLELSPEVVVLTNLEFDHTDYYHDLADVQSAFRSMLEKVPARGAIITDVENPNIQPILEGLAAPVIDYMQEVAYELRLPGGFNQMNARAARAAARIIAPELSEQDARASLADFHGTWRRFEYRGKTVQGAELYDDYAHHPTAIQETLRALRAKIPADDRIVVAFHPHLYSRTRDLFDGFITSFKDADEVLIAPIYAAREIDDGTVSSESLAKAIHENGIPARAYTTLGEVQEALSTYGTGTTIITMGAGDIYKVADALVAEASESHA